VKIRVIFFDNFPFFLGKSIRTVHFNGRCGGFSLSGAKNLAGRDPAFASRISGVVWTIRFPLFLFPGIIVDSFHFRIGVKRMLSQMVLQWVELGLIFSIMALGVYLTFRILDFPDLTVDGSFVTGAAVSATMIYNGYPPAAATVASLFAGLLAGCLTGILHTKGKINNLLSGILMMTALYSINLRIMGFTDPNVTSKPNVPLLNRETVVSQVESLGNAAGFPWALLVFFLVVTFIFKWMLDWFLKTEIGLAMRATGDNKRMIRSFSANTDGLIILGLGISNAYVALSGSLFAQYNEFADAGMGIGMIVVGLASVIIGEAVVGAKTIARATLAVVIGAILYRIIVGFALKQNMMDASDMKLITAAIVVLALIIPGLIEKRREKRKKAKRNGKRSVRQEEKANA
jgi:putative tryptophan/tyrosine transport system permease protein